MMMTMKTFVSNVYCDGELRTTFRRRAVDVEALRESLAEESPQSLTGSHALGMKGSRLMIVSRAEETDPQLELGF